VLDEAGALPLDEPDADQFALDAAIDAEVDQFRAFLDELDPDDFIDTTAIETSADPDDNDADADNDIDPDDADPDDADPDDADPTPFA
jgi:hypothetical protein